MSRPTLVGLLAHNAVAGSSRRAAYLPLAPLAPRAQARRTFSTSRRRRNAAGPGRSTADDARADASEQEKLRAQFRPVVDAFDAPIDMAVAYGSGVVKQANRSGPPPLTDYIFAVPSARTFHAINLRQHPKHYPLYARALGANVLAWMTDKLGAGLWYVTMVKIGDMEVKYGVISTPTLVRDLEQWETLYVAGRLHKPVLMLRCAEALHAPLAANNAAALALALLQLPPRFTELALWEQIAGISYSGDPRMSVPGAENPEKVRNIVRGDGVLPAFRKLYAPHVARVGLRWSDHATDLASDTAAALQGDVDPHPRGQPAAVHDAWRGEGEATLAQPTGTEHAASLLSQLPLRVRQRLAAHFRPTVAGALVSKEIAAERREVRERRRAAAAAQESRALYDDAEFWRRVAAQPDFLDVVNNEVRHIIKRPALTQSVKGLITAGFTKSVVYSAAKFRKWLAGRRKK